MVRSFAVAVAFSCLVSFAWAETQPGPATRPADTPTAKSTAKPAVRNIKPIGRPVASSDNAACDLGVIAAAGSPIGLKKVGITVFGNEYSEVPFDAWGIDDLIVARVRAAAGSRVAVRRIAYGKAALFELYEKPGKGLFNNPRENLTAVVRKIAANSHCARDIVITRFIGNLPGTNQSLEGVGVLSQGPFGSAAVFAYVKVAAFDGQTFAIRDDPYGGFGARLSSALSGLGKDEFLRHVEGAEFPASPETAAKDIKLRDAAHALLAERLDRILPEYLKQ
jgi:hypothetical protein